jgi:glycyl-tRNA synthetase
LATTSKANLRESLFPETTISTPYCITIDHDTLVDNAVTLRDRDTMKQERVPIEKLSAIVEEKMGVRKVLERLG